jgi:hypothetical protein
MFMIEYEKNMPEREVLFQPGAGSYPEVFAEYQSMKTYSCQTRLVKGEKRQQFPVMKLADS